MRTGTICPAGKLAFSLVQRTTPPAAVAPSQFAFLDKNVASQMRQNLASMLSKARALVKFVDERRDEARDVGIETIGIEVASLLDSGRLDRVASELDRSASEGRRSEISSAGMDTVSRLELLLSDSDRRKGSRPPTAERSSSPTASMGNSGQASTDQTETIVTVLGLGGLLLLLALLSG